MIRQVLLDLWDYLEGDILPCVCLNSERIILSLVVNHGWSLHQLDVSNAFLYGILSERVFMEQPPGYEVQGGTTQVCHLHCAFYGLKQSPHTCFAKFSQLILPQELTPCEVDPTIFRTSTSARCIILVVYVDILKIWSKISGITRVKAYFHRSLTI